MIQVSWRFVQFCSFFPSHHRLEEPGLLTSYNILNDETVLREGCRGLIKVNLSINAIAVDNEVVKSYLYIVYKGCSLY